MAYEIRQMGAIPPSAILSRKGIAIWGGILHWAAKDRIAVLVGPLSVIPANFSGMA